MSSRIPCTVQILTRNNAAGIKLCLDSLTMFDEVIVQDGFSTDGTRDIAASYPNVRLMDQNRAYLNEEGRITDFGAMRNESIAAAKHDWIFVVDGDEHVDGDLINEVERIVRDNRPGVYEAFRRFYVNNEPIMHSALYPALQIRLFHRSLTDGYVKPVHERLKLKEGVQKKMLRAELSVPQPQIISTLQPKYDRYLAMEKEWQGAITCGRWCKWVLVRNLRSVIGLSARLLWIWIVPRRGKRMPLSHELSYIRHQLRIIIHTFPLRTRAGYNRSSS